MSLPSAAANINNLCLQIGRTFSSRYNIQLESNHQIKLRELVAWYVRQAVENGTASTKSLHDVNRDIVSHVVPNFERYLTKNRVLSGVAADRIAVSAATPSRPPPIQQPPSGRDDNTNINADFARLQQSRGTISGPAPISREPVVPSTVVPQTIAAFPVIDDRGGPDPLQIYHRAAALRKEEAERAQAMQAFEDGIALGNAQTEQQLVAMQARKQAHQQEPIMRSLPVPDRPVDWLIGMQGVRDPSSAERVRMHDLALTGPTQQPSVTGYGATSVQGISQPPSIVQGQPAVANIQPPITAVASPPHTLTGATAGPFPTPIPLSHQPGRDQGLAFQGPAVINVHNQNEPEIIRQQHFLPPIPPIADFRRREHMLFLSSGDRDWYHSSESRYAFKVVFNSINGTTSASESTAARIAEVTGITDRFAAVRNQAQVPPSQANVAFRFNDVVRLELSKIIMPIEAIDVVVSQEFDSSGNSVPVQKSSNVFSFPEVNLSLQEFEAENHGTSDRFERAFGIVQKDTHWMQDESVRNKGFVCMLPKHLRCWREYHPAPLATFQSLSLRIERPNGTLLSRIPDVFGIDSMGFGTDTSGGIIGDSDSAFSGNDASGNPEYIFVVLKNWVPATAVMPGDTIVFKGYVVPDASGGQTPVPSDVVYDFDAWFNDSKGHYIVSAGHRDASGVMQDTANVAQYVNIIVIRNKFLDPSTGATTRDLWGGSSVEMDLRVLVSESLPATTVCKAINMTRQVHAIFTVVTRDTEQVIPPTTSLM